MAEIKVKLRSGETVPMEYPDGWSKEQVEEAIYKHFPDEKSDESAAQSQIPQTPFNVEEPEQQEQQQMLPPMMQKPPEKTGITGVASDFMHSLRNALSGGKAFVKDIPDSLERSGQYIEDHPFASLGHYPAQMAASTAELGKSLINAPHALNQYLYRKNLLPEWAAKGGEYIPHIPEDTGLEKTLGLEADPEKGDALFRAIPDVVSLSTGAGSLSRQLKRGITGPDLKQTIRQTQSKVNERTAETGKIFDTVKREVGERGLSEIPIDKDIINQSKKYLAKTPANKALIERAKTGDYEALRSLQADLRVKGEKAMSSALAAENKMGEEILSTRDQVNKSIQQHLEDTGHKDLAEMLNQARQNYKEIKDTYFSTPGLAKVFGKSQKVPKKPTTLLTEESTEMKRFMDAHPEVEKMLSKALKHDKKKKLASKVGKAAGIGTAAETAREIREGMRG